MAIGTNNLLVSMNLPTQIAQFILKSKVIEESMRNAHYFKASMPLIDALRTENLVLENTQKGLEKLLPTIYNAIAGQKVWFQKRLS